MKCCIFLVPIIPEVQTSYVTQELLKPKHKMTLTWEVRIKLQDLVNLRRDIISKIV